VGGQIVIILCFVVLTTLGFAQKNSIRTDSFDTWQEKLYQQPHKNVLDYYLLLPNDLFDCETDKKYNEEERKSKIKILDIKNGYIEFTGSYYNFTIALFKDTLNKKDFIAVSSNASGRGTTCGGYNFLFELLSDTLAWKYRKDLFPSKEEVRPYLEKYYSDLTDMFPYYELPRYGLNIKLREEGEEKPVYIIKWTGTRFKVIE
jgi:hypothetical protein